MEEIKEDSKQDEVFLELSKLYKSEKIEIYEHDDSIIQKAQRRHLLGSPPGTDKIKICDEVIWETLLARMDDDLIIVSRDGTYKDNHYYLSREYERKIDKKLLKVTDRISEGIKLIGETVSQEIADLEDKQIDDLIWDEVSDGWAGFTKTIKGRSGGWDPNLLEYEWNPIRDDNITTGPRNALHELIKKYTVTTRWLRKMDRKEAEEKLLKFQFPEDNGEDTEE